MTTTLACQPDLPGLTYALSQEWRNRRLIGLIKDSPRRFARSVQQDILAAKSGNEAESIHRLACAAQDAAEINALQRAYQMQECDADGIDADYAAQLEQDARALAVLKTKISERTVCLICGGLGHIGRLGEIMCATRTLGTKVTPELVKQIKYPDGIRPPDLSSSRLAEKRSARAVGNRSGYDSSTSRATRGSMRAPPRRDERRYERRTARGKARAALEQSPSEQSLSDSQRSDSDSDRRGIAMA